METLFNIVIAQSGFYLYGFGLLYVFTFLFNQNRKIELFKTSYKIIPFVGLIYLLINILYYLFSFFSTYYSGVEYEQYAFTSSVFVLLFSILYVFIPSQLFWFEKIKKSRGMIFFLCFFFLFSFERAAIFLSAFHSDYLPSTWTMHTGNVVWSALYSIVIFVSTTLMFQYKNNILYFIKLK